ncbi:MAG TPA: c-type cytochrome [Flavisolibacter sp.]|nr:c-type cytochrome [Flavisolibacter sp.]
MRTAYIFFAGMLFITITACSNSPSTLKVAGESNIAATRNLERDELVKRGNYLVTINTCGDCHSPKIMTPRGPVIDSTKILSGHPANTTLPPIDPSALQPGQWGGMSPDITAFAGPWGISYAANITPDSATGIGAWTEEQFIKTMRTGKHLGAPNGRPILPPMPWQFIAKMTDEDLSAVYAYLKSIPPVSNKVPGPTPPNEVKLKKS